MKKQIVNQNIRGRNYQNSKIFLILDQVDNEEFFGSTTQKYLSDVKAYYRNRLKNRKLSNPIFKKMEMHGFENFKFVLL